MEVFQEGAPTALAYIDGGTGSMIFQAAIGGVLTFGYFATTQWTRLKALAASLVRRSSRRDA